MRLPEFLRRGNPKENWNFRDKHWRNEHPVRLDMTHSFLGNFVRGSFPGIAVDRNIDLLYSGR